MIAFDPPAIERDTAVPPGMPRCLAEAAVFTPPPTFEHVYGQGADPIESLEYWHMQGMIKA